MLAHDQNLGGGNFFTQKTRYIQSVQSGHAYVQKNEIGQEFRRFLNGLSSIVRFTADFPIGDGCQNTLNPASHPFVVISNQNSHQVLVPLAEPRVSPGDLDRLDTAVFLRSGKVRNRRSPMMFSVVSITAVNTPPTAPSLDADWAKRKRKIALFHIPVAIQREQQVVGPGSLTGLDHPLQHGTNGVPDLRPAIAP